MILPILPVGGLFRVQVWKKHPVGSAMGWNPCVALFWRGKLRLVKIYDSEDFL